MSALARSLRLHVRLFDGGAEGFCASGVWPEGSDGTDINAVIRSHKRKVLALADDFCKVHLFSYPCATAKVSPRRRRDRGARRRPANDCPRGLRRRLPATSTALTAVT